MRREEIGARPRLHAPRLAALVAGELRRGILAGELADGAQLPKQEQLLAEYGVSAPTLREALRILESEGLVRVRRGKRGGAVVYRPTSAMAAYAIAKVLEADDVALSDVALALQALEPVCLELAARRADRHASVSKLRGLHEQTVTAFDDLERYRSLSHELHKGFVEASGSQTLALLAGALEALWVAHARERAKPVAEEVRRGHLAAHAAIIDAVERGDAERARRLAREHLCEATRYSLEPDVATPVESASLAPGDLMRRGQ
jgi:GntR family transcriptional regulator, transcriptional repressor for pyruvate dehydrogenase complex